ncbi:MAG: hypothetical protein P4L87_06955 [Formivibrio sp.]|nr:hypothetical protein [Formivibrio sp.]
MAAISSSERGLDDMLVYSLLRHAYRELNLPVFMTTGNHEAHQVPYGISPRQDAWALAAGVIEDEGAFGKAPHGLRPVKLGAVDACQRSRADGLANRAVPDWECLNRMFSDRYPIATEVTKINS